MKTPSAVAAATRSERGCDPARVAEVSTTRSEMLGLGSADVWGRFHVASVRMSRARRDPRNPRRLLRIGGERWSEQDKGKGQSAEMHYAAPAFSAWRQASRILAVAALCWPPKC